jgi:hypothetical protein
MSVDTTDGKPVMYIHLENSNPSLLSMSITCLFTLSKSLKEKNTITDSTIHLQSFVNHCEKSKKTLETKKSRLMTECKNIDKEILEIMQLISNLNSIGYSAKSMQTAKSASISKPRAGSAKKPIVMAKKPIVMAKKPIVMAETVSISKPRAGSAHKSISESMMELANDSADDSVENPADDSVENPADELPIEELSLEELSLEDLSRDPNKKLLYDIIINDLNSSIAVNTSSDTITSIIESDPTIDIESIKSLAESQVLSQIITKNTLKQLSDYYVKNNTHMTRADITKNKIITQGNMHKLKTIVGKNQTSFIKEIVIKYIKENNMLNNSINGISKKINDDFPNSPADNSPADNSPTNSPTNSPPKTIPKKNNIIKRTIKTRPDNLTN